MWLRLALLPFVGLALVAACGGSSRKPRHPGDEYLKKITVEGNQKIKTKTLTTGLALKRQQEKGRGPDPYTVSLDGERIKGEYLRHGYIGADVRSRVQHDGDAATVVFSVSEGKRAITRIAITGLSADDPGLTEALVLKTLPLKDGQPFDYEKYDLAREALLGIAKDAGYAYAKLDSTILADRANHVAVVQLDYTLGPKCTFGEVDISGVDGRLAEAVRDRLQFTPGQPFSNRALVATQRRLYGLQRFSTVQVQTADPAEATSSVVRVKVAVSEAARHEVKLGGGFGIDPTAYEIRGRAGYSIAGWPFEMDTVSVDLRPAYAYLRDGSGFQPRIRALAKLDRQDFLWTYAVGTVKAEYQYLAVEAYTYTGPRVGLGFRTPLFSQRLNAQVGWALDRVSFPVVSPLLDDDLQKRIGVTPAPQLIGAFSQGLSLDLRDNPIATTRGFYANVNVSESNQVAGSDFNYIQVSPDVRGYVPVGKVVFAARASGGAFFGKTPATERFFGGGATSQRGFGERQLSPSVTGDVDGKTRTVPYGGGAQFLTGVEARIPLTTFRGIGVGTVLFLDGGDVTETLADLNLGNLHWAAGTGLRLNTIVGPVRLDVGYRLNRKTAMDPAPGSSFAFHLSLGEAF